MTKRLTVAATLLFAISVPWSAKADTYDFTFTGGGVRGSIDLTYGTATDAKYPTQAFEITGVTGTFSDSNNGLNIVNAPIGSLVALTHSAPDPTNLLAPDDFSRYPVAVGLMHGAISFDNLYYPGGSPQTASDYPVQGGFLDIYGLLFNIGGGDVVNFWSNGDTSGNGAIDYGAAVVTPSKTLDYVGDGVSITPEPGALSLFAVGLLATLLWRRRAAASN